MPLEQGGETIITAHASKESKIDLKIFEAHTSVLIPLLLLPFSLVLLQISTTVWKYTVAMLFLSIIVLVILERYGITLSSGFKRARSRIMSRNRYATSKGRFRRRIKLNGFKR